MEFFLQGFGTILRGNFLLYMFAGVALGMVLGALPGLTGSLGIALMLPFTYRMDALTALVFLLSIYTGGLFGGAITAISINTPGSPANLMTMRDGYPMFKAGKGGKALGIALFASVIGGLIGCVFLVFAAEPMANFSLRFGNGEMFMVLFFGIACVGSLSKNPLKSFFAGMFGILLSTIGCSSSGSIRGTFGSRWLFDGLPMVGTMIGLLAIPEIVKLSQKKNVASLDGVKLGFKSIFSGFIEVIKRPLQTILCSILGVIVGIIPAAGSSVAGVLSYNESKQFCKNRDDFGKGVPEGVVASETANNASEGGALATMFVLGIPGSSSSAMLLAALALQGWAAGPKMFMDHKDVIYMAFSSLFLQQIVMLLLGILLCVCASYIVKVPNKYLAPIILAVAMCGAFANRNAAFDIGVLCVFGVIGLLMQMDEFPVLPLMLGYLLGGDAERNLVRIYQEYDSFFEIFKSPITLVLFIVAVFCIVFPIVMNAVSERKKKTAKGA